MKKLIIFAGALLLTAAGTAAFLANQPMNAEEALILKNVAALARAEGAGQTLDCWKEISAHDNQALTHKTYCGTCQPELCRGWYTKSTCTH